MKIILRVLITIITSPWLLISQAVFIIFSVMKICHIVYNYSKYGYEPLTDLDIKELKSYQVPCIRVYEYIVLGEDLLR